MFSVATMRPDSSGLGTFTCLYILIKLLKKRTLKASVFSRKPLETEGLAVVQFVIAMSCRLVNQSNYLNNSNKGCDIFSVFY